MASRTAMRSARLLKAPTRAPIRSNARQIRLQSTSTPQQSSQVASNAGGGGGSGVVAGIAGGAVVFSLGYGYYYYSGAKTIVDGAAATKRQFKNITSSMKDSAPEPNELLKWFRSTVTSYAAFIPGAKSYVDAAFNDLDKVEQKHRGKVDEIIKDAYSDMREATKGGLTIETAHKTWEILQKHLSKVTELASEASGEILDNHPQLKEKVGGNIDQLKKMADSYGPEAKEQRHRRGGKIREVVEENIEKLKGMGDQAWKKGLEKAQPYLDKNPEIKKVIEENSDALKQVNFSELFEKIKSGDVSDLKEYAKKAGEKAKSSGVGKNIQEYINLIPGGQEIVPKLHKLHEAVKKHGGEADKIAKEAYKEIAEILSKKADEVEDLASKAANDAKNRHLAAILAAKSANPQSQINPVSVPSLPAARADLIALALSPAAPLRPTSLHDTFHSTTHNTSNPTFHPATTPAPPAPVAPRTRAAPKPKANTTAKRAPKKAAAAGSKPVGVKKTTAAPKTGAAAAAVKAKVEKVKKVVEKKAAPAKKEKAPAAPKTVVAKK
ncbi:hypothetical protein VE04_06648 [Pseudogymnoascus sp. 24MN13]|nr:hypothetical protein VE04_06648 [Pseudogymnoascus sp. 24MN13]